MTRLCATCQRHEAIRDGRDCADCTNAFLRATRPAALREPAWTPQCMRRIADPVGMGATSTVARDWTGRNAA